MQQRCSFTWWYTPTTVAFSCDWRIDRGSQWFFRAAKIRTSTGETNQPFAKLNLLKLSATATCSDNGDITAIYTCKDDNQDSNSEIACKRPSSNSAPKAYACLKNWTDMLTVAWEDVYDLLIVTQCSVVVFGFSIISQLGMRIRSIVILLKWYAL